MNSSSSVDVYQPKSIVHSRDSSIISHDDTRSTTSASLYAPSSEFSSINSVVIHQAPPTSSRNHGHNHIPYVKYNVSEVSELGGSGKISNICEQRLPQLSPLERWLGDEDAGSGWWNRFQTVIPSGKPTFRPAETSSTCDACAMTKTSAVFSGSSEKSISSSRTSSTSTAISTAPSSRVALPLWNQQSTTIQSTLPISPLARTHSLPCEFNFLGCEIRFEAGNFDDWVLHSLSHFCGRNPPETSACPFCTEKIPAFNFQGDVFVKWRERMRHIDQHLSQHPEIDFHQVNPDPFLFSYLIDLDLLNFANPVPTLQGFSSRLIVHHHPSSTIRKSEEVLLDYNKSIIRSTRPSSYRSKKSIPPILTQNFEKEYVLPNSNVRMSHHSDLAPLDRNASIKKLMKERSLNVLDDLDKERREMRRWSRKGKGVPCSRSQQPRFNHKSPAELDDVSYDVLYAASQTLKLLSIGKETNSPSLALRTERSKQCLLDDASFVVDSVPRMVNVDRHVYEEKNELQERKISEDESDMNALTAGDISLSDALSDQTAFDHENGAAPPDHLSESMSTCTVDQTDWEESSDDESGYAGENISLRVNLTRQLSICPDRSQLMERQILTSEVILVNRLMEEFWVLFDQNWNDTIRHHGTGDCAGSGSTSHATTSEQGSQNFRNRKRARGKDRENPDDGDERASKRSGKQPAIASVSTEPQYACPYRKYNPRKYCVQYWKLCAITSHKSVARVKAHLYNYHMIHQCPRCKQLFDTTAILEVHTLATDSCQVRIIEQVDGITSKIKEQLQCRRKAFPGQTEAERWVQVYKIIFQPKDDSNIPSPYFEPIHDQDPAPPLSPESRVFLEYEDYFRRELPRHFHEILESAISNEIQPIEERLRQQFMSFLEEAQNRTFSSFRTRFNVQAETKPIHNMEDKPGESSKAMLEAFFRPPPYADLDTLSAFALPDGNPGFENIKDDNLDDSAYVSGSPQDQDFPQLNMENVNADDGGPSSSSVWQPTVHLAENVASQYLKMGQNSSDFAFNALALAKMDVQDETSQVLEVSQASSTLAANPSTPAQNNSQDDSLMSSDFPWALLNLDSMELGQTDFEAPWTFNSKI